MNLYRFHNQSTQLVGFATATETVPKLAWSYYYNNPDELKRREYLWIRDPKIALQYCRRVLGSAWPEAESVIAQDFDGGYQYAIQYKRPLPKIEQELIEKYKEHGRAYAIRNYYKSVFKKKQKWPAAEDILASDPEGAYYYAKKAIDGPWPQGEKAIRTAPEFSYRYARYVLRGPWPQGEITIAKTPSYLLAYIKAVTGPRPDLARLYSNNRAWAYKYARDVIKKPWPEGEPAIARSAEYSYRYARNVIQNPWPPGEPILIKSANRGDRWGVLYAKEILKSRWPSFEKTILSSSDMKALETGVYYAKMVIKHRWPKLESKILDRGDKKIFGDYMIYFPKFGAENEKLIAKSAQLSLDYAIVTKQRFRPGEPLIVQEPSKSYLYALDVLNGPFPEGEPAIAQHPHSAYEYAKNILNGPFPEGEPAIAQSSYYAYSYALVVLNGPFPPGEPAIAQNRALWKQYLERFPERKPN